MSRIPSCVVLGGIPLSHLGPCILHILIPKGPKSLRGTIGSASSYNVNFHCDFFNLFLEVWGCTSFAGI
jgi:hypothetical protein